MTVTVVVPTWRRADDLARCIEGLTAQTRPPHEVLVVARRDDGATWSALEGMQATMNGMVLRPIEIDVPGVVPSLNAGLNAATGDIVAITDDDAVPRPDWVSRIADEFDRQQDLGGVGGRDWVHEDGAVLDGTAERVGQVRWSGRMVGGHHLGVGTAREVDVLKGVNMALRRSAIAGIRLEPGLRGSGMQMHWEVALCLALKRDGWKLVYDPAIAVDHYPAPRLDEAKRVDLAGEGLANEVYNLTLGLLKGLPGWRKAIAFAYGVVVGTRLAPGPVIGLEQRARGRAMGSAVRVATRARLQALADFSRGGTR